MEPVKANQVLSCDKCGVELRVTKDCDSSCACNIICCGQPMKVQGAQQTAETAARSCCR